MSDLERTVQIIFEAVDSLTGPLTDMSSSLSDFGANAETASGEATDLSSSIESIPEDLYIEAMISGDAIDELNDITNTLDWIPEYTETEISVNDEYSDDIDTIETFIDELPEDIEIDVSYEDTDGDKLQAEIDLLEAKRLAIESGEGLINIDSTGLEPALEMIMWEIMAKVQLKANEDGAAFLLGV